MRSVPLALGDALGGAPAHAANLAVVEVGIVVEIGPAAAEPLHSYRSGQDADRAEKCGSFEGHM